MFQIYFRLVALMCLFSCLILAITTSKQIATVTDSVQPQGGGDVVTVPAKGELKRPLNSMLYAYHTIL